MSNTVESLRERIGQLQDQLEAEFESARSAMRYRLDNNRVVWEEGVRRRHRNLRARLAPYLVKSPPRHLLTAPVIYSLIVPFALLDLFVSLYQAICFRAYGIPRVRRAEYIRFDRHHLAYLNSIQKVNCFYCGYVNGLIAYVAEIAGRTEAYWCPIKHAARVQGRHRHYDQFMEYGDGEAYAEGLKIARRRMQEIGTPPRSAPAQADNDVNLG
ncbi:hypothetical protein [Pseudooceanicola sp.]|uniref:hypothetical protein n=1 Tax=Pseudooceanicola sp. TaxID=1914328 RepID=UPI0035C6FFAE